MQYTEGQKKYQNNQFYFLFLDFINIKNLFLPHYTLQAIYGALRGFLKIDMAKGFVSIGHSSNGSIDYYGRDEECLGWRHSDKDLETFEDVKAAWKKMEQDEKLGNKELGIRGRHDARVRTNYILSMPNELSPQECVNRVQNIINQTDIKNCTYTIFVHNGEKDGVKNSHVHLLVNERDKTTGKKSREMIKKEWLEKKFRPLFEKEFLKERQEAPNYARRERLPVGLYESDTKQAKNEIQGIYEVFKEQDRTLPTHEEIKKMKYDEFQIWRSYEFGMRKAEEKGIEIQSWKSYRDKKLLEQKIEAQNKAMKREKRPNLGL